METHCNWWMWSSLGGFVLIIYWHGWFERWQDVAVLLLMWLDVMCRLRLILRTHLLHNTLWTLTQSSAQLSQKAKFCWWRWRQVFHTERDSSSGIQIREQDCTSTKASHHTTITKNASHKEVVTAVFQISMQIFSTLDIFRRKIRFSPGKLGDVYERGIIIIWLYDMSLQVDFTHVIRRRDLVLSFFIWKLPIIVSATHICFDMMEQEEEPTSLSSSLHQWANIVSVENREVLCVLFLLGETSAYAYDYNIIQGWWNNITQAVCKAVTFFIHCQEDRQHIYFLREKINMILVCEHKLYYMYIYNTAQNDSSQNWRRRKGAIKFSQNLHKINRFSLCNFTRFTEETYHVTLMMRMMMARLFCILWCYAYLTRMRKP